MDILSGLLTPVIAAIAVYIAYQQWQTNDLKVKLDLFDRRLQVYHVISNVIWSVIIDGQLNSNQLGGLHRTTSDAEFLLGKDVADYVIEMQDRGDQMLRVQKSYRDASMSARPLSEIEEILRRDEILKEWFSLQPARLKDLFRPHLSLMQQSPGFPNGLSWGT